MILGMSVATFTLLHVILSLLGILFGLIALAELIGSRSSGLVTALFLGFTTAASVTGFLFPFTSLDPARIVGIVSLAALACALTARYGAHLAGRWRVAYVASAVFALYLNVFVAVAQGFMKIPALRPLAPTGSEPPFVAAQGVVLLVFVALGIMAARRFIAPAPA
ncbi:MAG TPA: hypothetical protein VME42_01860 [Steroidobacteraceae bacterium]|nr:hypothetical protein [Steroidobacteraceae bacterium]